MNIIEEYKPIEGYNGKYYISNTGKVFVTDYRGNKIWKEMQLRVIKGYYSIGLRKMINDKSVQTLYKVHRLVATHFIPNINNKPCINHIDGNKLNNNVYNLEWVTVQENTRHAYANKLQKNWWSKELAIVAINLIENYGYNYSNVAELFKIKLNNAKGSVANLYQRGYKTFGLHTLNIRVPKHSKPKEITKEYKEYINKLLTDNTVLNY